MMSMMIMTMMTMGNDSDYYNSGERYSDYDDEDEGDYDDEDEGDCDGDCDGDYALDDDVAFFCGHLLVSLYYCNLSHFVLHLRRCSSLPRDGAGGRRKVRLVIGLRRDI